jgi:formylglycine-generating enzyme required for sulfatase activity/serine/threonine protein kinase
VNDAPRPNVEQMPVRLGRYRVTNRIAWRLSGTVYRAWDDELRRDVAITVPSRDWLNVSSKVEEYLTRARQVSRLDHPGIVPVFDLGRTDEGDCYLVCKYMSGGNLAERLGRSVPAPARSVEIATQIADVLHFAHKSGVVHGNVAPSCVLFYEHDRPCLADFGLPQLLIASAPADGPAGQAAYRSPEQLRGEQHRVDARTDIYGLGAVFYELLSGSWPPCQQPISDVVRQAMHYEPPFLSDVAPAVPAELARICHKALARRVADRYTTIVDFADDLRQAATLIPFGAAPSEMSTTVGSTDSLGTQALSAATTSGAAALVAAPLDGETRVVPKGLRSFDQEDADFFLELLPGPRGRDGLPESLRFWKSQIEQADAEKTFGVGLIYGPSGCGKSSLVKAGLLPHLDHRVLCIYLEATPEGTEARLLAQLRRRCPLLPQHLSLTDSIAELRRAKVLAGERKVLIVLDQFEQWLHANRDREHPELSQALRQCDGRRVQSIVMVRDDFWMAVTRFMHDLDVTLVEGHNSAAVDLFGLPHARKVLLAFGRAYGALSGANGSLAPREAEFLDGAVSGLAHDGKVVSVQLALFAEMIRNRPWTTATLEEVGGAEGVGLAFLEETFNAAHAPPEHRRHQRAARAVLKRLLPEQGTDIKGQMRSRAQLLAASGYADRPQEFNELLRILDQELRLVTPADPEGLDTLADAADPRSKESVQRGVDVETAESISAGAPAYFQLTHDFLVPSVRRWLVRRQQETRRGRAELLLEEKAATWGMHPERRYLPSLWYTARIRLLTRSRDWSAGQRAMMRSATRQHGFRLVALASLLLLLGRGAWEAYGFAEARTCRDQLLYAATPDIPGVLREINRDRRWVNRVLRTSLASSDPNAGEEWRIRLALLPDDAAQAGPLIEHAAMVDDQAFAIIRDSLSAHRAQVTHRLWQLLEDPSAEADRRLRAAMLLAHLVPPPSPGESADWQKNAPTIAALLHAETVKDPARFQFLVTSLAPVGDLLIDPLAQRAHDTSRPESDRAIAANLLAEYAAERPQILIDLLLEAENPSRMAAIIEKLQPQANQAAAPLEAELAKRPEDLRSDWHDEPLQSEERPSPQNVAMLDAASGMRTERFAFCQTLPLSDFQPLAESLGAVGYRPTRFRPYRDGDLVRVAVVWTRDARSWKLDQGLTEEELQAQVTGSRMGTELLIDLACWDLPDGERRHAALWAQREPNDPEARAFIGHNQQNTDQWDRVRSDAKNEGFGVVSLDFHAELPDTYSVLAVLWKGSETATFELRAPKGFDRDLASDLAARSALSIDLTSAPYVDRAEARLGWDLAELAIQENANRTNPEKLFPWFLSGQRGFLAGQYEKAIQDFTHYIEHGGEHEPDPVFFKLCHEYRTYAAARLGRREQATLWLEQAIDAWGRGDSFGARLRTTLFDLFLGDVRDQPESFEALAKEWSDTTWAHHGAAQVFAVAAGITRKHDPARAAAYTDRAIQHLQQAIANGDTNNIWWYLTDVLFQPIFDDPRMIKLQIDAELDANAAIKYARQGHGEQARQELLTLLRKGEDPASNSRAEVLVALILGDDARAQQLIESAGPDEPEWQEYWGRAGACSVASYLLAKKDPEHARWFADRAFEILERKAASHWGGTTTAIFRRELLTNWLFAPLLHEPRMQATLAALDRLYSVVYSEKSDMESRIVRDLDPAEHRVRCRELAASGFRPVAIDGCRRVGATGLVAASVWQRPAIPPAERDRFARRQATATVAAARLGRPELLWPLLRFDPQPRLQSWLVELLGPAGTDPKMLDERLDRETDVSVRRAILLALGKTPFNRLGPDVQHRLVERLLTLLRQDRDPGTHSAAEWALRKWGQDDKLKEIRQDLPAAGTATQRGWTANSNGDVLVTVPGPAEFWIGSPADEPDRADNETRHRRRVLRGYQIATKEVTVRQFEEFSKDQPRFKANLSRTTSPERDCPAGMVTWYTVAAYCRWLSERERIPEEEIGFPPYDEIRPGMKLKPYFLSRSGYRIPTEAEFEYACRGGTSTRWYHGDSLELLPQYAWSKENAEGRSWPVGTLRPNELGLFDMEGNIQELCLQYLTYPRTPDEPVRDDAYSTRRTPAHLALHNGSFANPRRETRAGMRFDPGNSPYETPLAHIGFRIVRTLIPPELQRARDDRRKAIDLRNGGQESEADRSLKGARATYERFLADHPENPDHAWELAEFLMEPVATNWQMLDPLEMTSREGTTLTRQPDGSILATGTNAPLDRYTIRVDVKMPDVTALRLEALPHSQFPSHGPGRSENGNFELSELRVRSAAGSAPDGSATIPIRRVSADFSQSRLPIGNSADGKLSTHWGIAGETGHPHWAIFELAKPVGNATGTVLVLTLDFADWNWKHHTLGRFRLSATNEPRPARIDLWRARLARSSLSGWARLGAAYGLLGESEAARAALARAGQAPTGEYIDDWFLMALIHHEVAQPEVAGKWLERGLAKFNKSTDDEDLKLLAGSSAIVALEQDPPDVSLLARLESLLGISQTGAYAPHEILLARGRERIQQGNVEGAVDDFGRALNLLPKLYGWGSPRARTAFTIAEFDEAFEKLAARGPDTRDLWLGRARRHAYRSEWKEAADDLSKVTEAIRPGLEWVEYCGLLLLAGKPDEYARLSRAAIEMHGKADDGNTNYLLARGTCLSPDPLVPPSQILSWAERGFNDDPKPWRQRVIGLAQLRAGMFEEAIRNFEQASTGGQDESGQILNLLGLALVYAQMGNESASHQHLERALAMLAENAILIHPNDWTELNVLRREVESTMPTKR